MLVAANTTLQILRLRVLMTNLTIGAYIIPLQDAHQGTRTPACSARLSYISGFTGSSGTALVTGSEALLWTDGRYFTQALDELDGNWKLMREGIIDTPTMEAYLGSALGQGALIGVDPALFSKTAWNRMQSSLRNGQKLHPVPNNLIDEVWGEERPECPKGELIQISTNFSGRTTQDKLAGTRIKMAEKNAEVLVINQLDDIAWLLNLRGYDIPAAALFLSFAIVKTDGFELFIDQSKVTDVIRNSLTQDGGSIYNYDEVNDRLSALVNSTSAKIWLASTCSYSLVSIVPEARQLIELSPIVPLKAVKNPTEIAGVKSALIRDAAILARFYTWVENAVTSGQNVTELIASDYLMNLRRQHDLFLTVSFTTIVGSDSNGAIIHYRPTPETNKRVTQHSMLLIDAGATYMDGTTDITRTFHFGTPSNHQREAYTRVLKGQIAVAKAVFPPNTRGNRLDSFARKYLWDIGLDYGHGTGHGIGINVHEGPNRITYDYNLAVDDRGLVENMLTSNEPGYYEEGSFGIRLENIVRVVNSTVTGINGKSFLSIEDMTFLPYQHKLIKKELLTQPEVSAVFQL
ncbi:Xaa-Pro aminopeptidase 1 [Orchesella cincta]|uniref:Xaa-Pro aminopeptidase 1 n=1 Tax=Orchesella cincta TaxID=48709 RepID=A0A1D2N8N9_ORCCI|nr:Xaa-Pro aminopeptidase 1 [Orchesella cincta]